jgi:predicted alpha/beta superfamily hydrolase
MVRGHLHHTRAYTVPGLHGTRACTVYLPPGYFEQTGRRYPVAYFFDGQNMFDDHTSFAGGWRLHHLLDERAAQGKPVPLVVAVHHGGPHRNEDLSPWGIGRGHRGRADALLDWMTGELARFVHEDLRVLPGPENTLVGGSSLGGLAAVYAFFKYPHVFGRVLAMSPSLWVHRHGILHLAAHQPVAAHSRIYLDAGGREMGGACLRDAEHLAGLLHTRGLGGQVMWRPDKRGVHNERNWRRRLPKALRFLYDGSRR